MKQLIECVPNISEGKNIAIIREIATVVTTVKGVKLLGIEPGRATNRSVITFAGEPDVVVEAAFLLIKKASELIDMSKQKGEHPRFGATDVCPLIPLSGITVEEVIPFAHNLGKRVGEELGIPGYFYEYAASEDKRKNLANCRAGEYEGLKEKLIHPDWKPDFGPASFNDTVKKSGAVAISARDFLIAYNVNLKSTSEKTAKSIASELRESGRILYDENDSTKKLKDEFGKTVRIPGKLKAVKGMGWYIPEYGIAQISYNLTNINVTPMHIAFDETVKSAADRGVKVTGSELIGLIPLKAMIQAGEFYLKKFHKSLNVSDEEKIKLAITSLGLDDLRPFNPNEKIIEYCLGN